jgi:hypothetical protein
MSEQVKGGGPAFPQGKQVGQCSVSEGGMTLRDYFAAKAMQGICAHPDNWGLLGDRLAKEAYRVADAMLIARDTDTTER